MKDNFILYTLYYDAIMRLTDEQAGRLLKAIYRYVKTEQEEDITDPSIAFAYTLVITQVKESSRKYEEKCKRLRENASKGGLQKAANASNDLQEQANATEDSKSKQMVVNGSKCKQNLADVSIRQDKTRQDKTTINKEDKDKKDEPSLCAEAQSSSSSEFSQVVEYWNAAVEKHGSAMRPLRGLTENRKAAIRARLREHKPNGMEAIRQMIDRATVSDFLNGKNSRNAIFTFDRLMSPSMFQKTLEGNYDNHAEQQQAQPTQQEPSSITRLMDEREQQQPDKDFEAYQRFTGMIEIVKRNPKHRCMAALRTAYENKTLQGLGIDWKPSDTESN